MADYHQKITNVSMEVLPVFERCHAAPWQQIPYKDTVPTYISLFVDNQFIIDFVTPIVQLT